MSRPTRLLLALCFFLSGATSLVLEVAWAKELSYALGNSIQATSTVIAAFMAGLGLGSAIGGRPKALARSPIAIYGGLQLAIGVLGFFSIPLLRATDPLFESVYQDLAVGPRLFLLVRFGVLFPLMTLPATLMGMSLPLVVEARSGEGLGAAANAGLFYGVNTLGAVTGTYLAGFVMIPSLGLLETCRWIGAADFAVGLLLFALYAARRRSARVAVTPQPEPGSAPDPAIRVARTRHGGRRLFGALFFVSGFLSMVYEVAWFRLLSNVLGGTVHAFTSMLGVFLIGVGLGSVVGSRLPAPRSSPFVGVALGLFAIAIGAASSLLFANGLPARYAALFAALDGGRSLAGIVLAQALLAAVVVLPTAFAMGVLFPLALRAYESLGHGARDRRDASEIYALNTFGGICGSLATGFVILPQAGLRPTLFVASAASAVLGLAVLGRFARGETTSRRAVLATAGTLGTAVMLVSVPEMDHLELHRGVFFEMPGTRDAKLPDEGGAESLRLLYYREGLHGSVSITSDRHMALRLSGKPVATSEFHDRVHLGLLGHLPVLFADSPRDVAVIGLGMGVTAGALASHPGLRRVEIAELEPAILEVQPYFEAMHGNPHLDPRFEMILEDGRTHLTYTDQRYDVITSDPISPIIAGAANLYTRDFYRLAASRLRSGGVFAQWWEMVRVDSETYQGVLATMREVFPHLLVFVYGEDSVILGSEAPLEVEWTQWQRRLAEPAVQRDLAGHGLDQPLDLVGLLWADGAAVDRFVRGTDRRNTDDNAWLEHQMPIDRYAPKARATRIPRQLALATVRGRLERIERVLPGIPPAALLEHLVRRPPTRDPSVHEASLRALASEAAEQSIDADAATLRRWHAERRTQRQEVKSMLALEMAQRAAVAQGDAPAIERTLRALFDRVELPIAEYWGVRLVERLEGAARHDEALELLAELARRSPGRLDHAQRAAALAHAAARPERAARERARVARLEARVAGAADGAPPSRPIDFELRDLVNWALRLNATGHYGAAERHARAALERGPESVPAILALGYALFQQDRIVEARERYRHAVALAPDSLTARSNLAGAAQRLRDWDEAVREFETAQRLAPDDERIAARLEAARLEQRIARGRSGP